MRPTLALAIKDLRLLFRDRVAFFFTFVFPLIVAVFFGYVFAGPKPGDGASELRVLLADLDNTDASRAFARRLDAHNLVAVEPVETENDARAAVLAGRRSAAIILPPGFGDASGGLFVGQAATVRLALDPSRVAEGAMLQGVLMEVAFAAMQNDFQNADAMRTRVDQAREMLDQANLPPHLRAAFDALLTSSVGLAEQIERESQGGDDAAPTDDAGVSGWAPVSVETVELRRNRGNRPDNAFEVTFPQAIMWGVLGACFGFATSLVTERTKGTLMRLRVAPMSPLTLLRAKALACFVTMLLVVATLLFVGVAFFDVRAESPALLALAVLSASACFCGIMMLLAVLSRSEAAAGGFGWGVLLILAMLGGGMIPLFAMPGWMQRVSVFSPVSWAIRAMEGAIWRGFTPRQMLAPCALLVGCGVVCFAVGVLGFRRLERA